MKVYLGIDVGSVSTKFAVVNSRDKLVADLYLPTQGNPIDTVQKGLKQTKKKLPKGDKVSGVAATGSARNLAGVVIGADLVKNEITCQALATISLFPDVQTILEIGGQDSKIIIVRKGAVTDFGMNTVCAAGTGSFLDHQAQRLNISIGELAEKAMLSLRPAPIAGRCTVFAESDMIHKQQVGYHTEDIIYGLCQALVRNFLSSVGAGKDIQPPIVFQGGVAYNQGIVRALRAELHTEIIVPDRPELMGAIGAAQLVRESMTGSKKPSQFKGFSVSNADYHMSSTSCGDCHNHCDVLQLSVDGNFVTRWGGRCGAWDSLP